MYTITITNNWNYSSKNCLAKFGIAKLWPVVDENEDSLYVMINIYFVQICMNEYRPFQFLKNVYYI